MANIVIDTTISTKVKPVLQQRILLEIKCFVLKQRVAGLVLRVSGLKQGLRVSRFLLKTKVSRFSFLVSR